MSKVSLSPYSEIFYNEWKIDPFRNDYNLVFFQTLNGNLQIKRLRNAIKRFINEHFIFNSHILKNKNGQLFWTRNSNKQDLLYIDNSYQSYTNKEIFDFIAKPFDLEKGPLYRFLLLKNKSKKYNFIIVLHHIIIDGNNFNNFIDTLSRYYNDEKFINQLSIEHQKITLNNLANRQFDFIKSIEKNSLEFWKNKLLNSEDIDFSFMHNNKNQGINKNIQETYNIIEEIEFHFQRPQVSNILKNSKYDKLSSYLYGQIIFALLLHLITGKFKFCISFPSKMIDSKEITLGSQINTNMMIYDFSEIYTLNDLMYYSYKLFNYIKAQDFIYTPVYNILSKAIKDTCKCSFIQTKFKNKKLNFVNIKSCTQKGYDLDLIGDLIFEQEFYDTNKILFKVKYKSSYISKYYVNNFIACYKALYENVLNKLSTLKYEININVLSSELIKKKLFNFLKEDDQKNINIIQEFKKGFFYKNTIHEIFQEQVIKNPEANAVTYNKSILTYDDLNRRANYLANYLLSHSKIKTDDLISFLLDRSEKIIICILAILKSGAAYVPIDPEYPDGRIYDILEDSKPKVLLVNNNSEQKILNIISSVYHSNAQPLRFKVINIDNINFSKDIDHRLTENLNIAVTNQNLAYVIYTSGTTGKPKGVMVEHRNIINYGLNIHNFIGIQQKERVDFSTSIGFDLTVTNTLVALCCGAHIIVYSGSLLDINEYKNHIIKSEINLIKLVPSYFELIIEVLLESKINKVILGGEKVKSSLKQKIHSVLKYYQRNITIYDEYGPTETTVGCSISKVYPSLNNNLLNIGRPYFNCLVQILDNNMKPVKVGDLGELYIEGSGVARGYLNQKELTAKSFLMFDKKNKVYKTGDLGRLLPDGNIEYIGRNDSQIKIRGYRIEPAEIENCITALPEIKQSIVIYKNKKLQSSITDGFFVAYCVKKLNLTEKDKNEFIDGWKSLYAQEYQDLNIINYKYNFVGWISSYTRKQIEEKEMIEWLDCTISKIKRLAPKVILEIGSGSGLLVFNLIDYVDHYYASDFSKIAIKHLEDIKNKNGIYNLTSIYSEASDIEYNKIEKSIDTVIINSVAQYFPNLNYLELVIQKAISEMDNEGHIFIGDIRDYRLLECFHYSIQKFHEKNPTISEINYFSSREKELLISPEYFIYLQKNNSNINYIELTPKLGVADNELNKYRYDVILHINKANGSDKSSENPKKINESEFVYVDNLFKFIDENMNAEYLAVKHPHKKILTDFIPFQQQVNNRIILPKKVFSINDINAYANSKGLVTNFYLDIHNPLLLNLIIHNHKTQKNKKFFTSFDNKANINHLSNSPLVSQKLIDNNLVDKIRQFLEYRLPHYMIPRYFIFIDKIPLNINGKLDVDALPYSNFDIDEDVVLPRNEMEKKIHDIWSNVLGIRKNKISINCDFFKLGGNSILAIKLANKLEKEYECKIMVVDIYKNNNIEKISNYIKNILSSVQKGKIYEF